jgi:hypothetical protein
MFFQEFSPATVLKQINDERLKTARRRSGRNNSNSTTTTLTASRDPVQDFVSLNLNDRSVVLAKSLVWTTLVEAAMVTPDLPRKDGDAAANDSNSDRDSEGFVRETCGVEWTADQVYDVLEIEREHGTDLFGCRFANLPQTSHGKRHAFGKRQRLKFLSKTRMGVCDLVVAASNNQLWLNRKTGASAAHRALFPFFWKCRSGTWADTLHAYLSDDGFAAWDDNPLFVWVDKTPNYSGTDYPSVFRQNWYDNLMCSHRFV